uniref:Uncharacterized protein n=1 Tax=Trieres chinensis TaxID=1514140 RepID=A0A7S1ZDM4_TRICV|mmetsp:Transcript_22880/g.46469  ORF Transcript_22880/g.46469 Transcript_22880/m.46469 type:complete len:508 (+) Transcript_22880:286-1809(+)
MGLPALFPSFLSPLLSLPLLLLRSGLNYVLDGLVLIALLYAFLHRLGVSKRILIWWAERELSKIGNGALFTVGDAEVDLTTGHVVATDLVIHAPRRDEWIWDSPLIARLGKLDVSVNILSCVDYVGPALGFPCKDIHSVTAEDIQVFVEKRQNVFNFHLLDPSLDLPDPSSVIESIQESNISNKGAVSCLLPTSKSASMVIDPERSLPLVLEQKNAPAPKSLEAEAKANEIVNNLVGAVSSVGRAANEGGKQGLHLALMNQKEGFVSQLKEFQAKLGGGREESQQNGVRAGRGSPQLGGASRRPPLRKGELSLGNLAKDGAQVMRHLGKVVEQNVSNIKQQVDSFQKPPPKKDGWVNPAEDVRFRFGRITLRDMRIFTKDMIAMKNAGGGVGGSSARGMSMPDIFGDGGEQRLASSFDVSSPRVQRSPSTSGWSDPIHIRELAVSGAELCPPMTTRDECGLPEIGLKIEKVLDILLARLLAETAKSNTGRVLNNAFGEVFTWMELKR